MEMFGMAILDVMLWISLFLLIIGAVLPKKNGHYVAAAGWVVFGIRWGLSTPQFYFNENNIMYTVLCIIAVPLSFYAAYVMARFQRESVMVITRSVAISSLFYFPFAYLPWLSNWLISVTTVITLFAVNAIGNHAFIQTLDGQLYDIINLNGQTVQIILACTAIQSMAIFVGVISCCKVEFRRWLSAFMVTVPVIYILNVVRNTFVISAFGNQWFQIMPETIVQWTGKMTSYTSFFWAHNVLAELGSLIALVAISYVVLMMMPELLVYLRDALNLLKTENVKKMLKGEEVPVIAPVKTVK